MTITVTGGASWASAMVGARSAATAYAMQAPIRIIVAAFLLNLRGRSSDAFYHDARPRGTVFFHYGNRSTGRHISHKTRRRSEAHHRGRLPAVRCATEPVQPFRNRRFPREGRG